LNTNPVKKDSIEPITDRKILAKQKDRGSLKTVPHIPPRISKIIQRFVKDANQILRKNVIAEYLFGSYATNTYTQLSDIDILFIVNTFTPEIRRQMSGLASEYSLEYDVFISPIIKDSQVWSKNKQFQTLFYQEITQHGIRL